MIEKRRRKNKSTETPITSKLLIMQLICAGVIILILFGISKSSGGISQNIKNFYAEVKSKDMPVSEVLGTFKSAAKETFAPVKLVETTENVETTGESETASPDFLPYEN